MTKADLMGRVQCRGQLAAFPGIVIWGFVGAPVYITWIIRTAYFESTDWSFLAGAWVTVYFALALVGLTCSHWAPRLAGRDAAGSWIGQFPSSLWAELYATVPAIGFVIIMLTPRVDAPLWLIAVGCCAALNGVIAYVDTFFALKHPGETIAQQIARAEATVRAAEGQQQRSSNPDTAWMIEQAEARWRTIGTERRREQDDQRDRGGGDDASA